MILACLRTAEPDASWTGSRSARLLPSATTTTLYLRGGRSHVRPSHIDLAILVAVYEYGFQIHNM